MNTKRFADYLASKEKTVTSILIGILFCLLLSMILFVGFSSVEKESLQMKTEAERAFNSIYMALNKEPNALKANQIMKEEGVIGIGIYSSDGKLFRNLGTVPYVIPYDQFDEEDLHGGNAGLGIYSFNHKTQILHYMRLARLAIDLDTGNLDAGSVILGESGILSTNLDFPEILYVVMEGSAYFKSIVDIWVFTGIAIIVLVLIFILLLRLYFSNRCYKEMLNKQESLVSLGAAARTLAHEIKNPLSAMTIQVALMKRVLPSEYRGDLAVIDQEILRLIQLTNKVSDFLRNPVGNPQLIEVRGFLDGIKELFPEKIEFTSDSLEEAYIEFDQDRARSVFENLLKNSVESCTGRDPQVMIDIQEKKKGQLSISILDRGDGLPKVDKSKFFDPFFTTKIHGSGIGLSITRQFLKAKEGSVSLVPRDGGGTKAEVLLPSVPLKFAHAMLRTAHDELGEKNENTDCRR